MVRTCQIQISALHLSNGSAHLLSKRNYTSEHIHVSSQQNNNNMDISTAR